jgi:hypothetical protein
VQREAGVRDDAQVVNGQVVAQPLVGAGIRHHQRRIAGHDVLAERVRQRGLPARGPRLGQPDLAGEHLPVRVDQRHQRDRGVGQLGRGPGQAVQGRVFPAVQQPGLVQLE